MCTFGAHCVHSLCQNLIWAGHDALLAVPALGCMYSSTSFLSLKLDLNGHGKPVALDQSSTFQNVFEPFEPLGLIFEPQVQNKFPTSALTTQEIRVLLCDKCAGNCYKLAYHENQYCACKSQTKKRRMREPVTNLHVTGADAIDRGHSRFAFHSVINTRELLQTRLSHVQIPYLWQERKKAGTASRFEYKVHLLLGRIGRGEKKTAILFGASSAVWFPVCWTMPKHCIAFGCRKLYRRGRVFFSFLRRNSTLMEKQHGFARWRVLTRQALHRLGRQMSILDCINNFILGEPDFCKFLNLNITAKNRSRKHVTLW